MSVVRIEADYLLETAFDPGQVACQVYICVI